MNRRELLSLGLTAAGGLVLTRIPYRAAAKPVENAPARSSITLPWQKAGGPLGGLGYNIRYRPDEPETFFVTDAWSGLQRSTDGGANWKTANEGITARSGPSGDSIPIFAFRIDPNDPRIMWAGTENGEGVYRSTDGGDAWQRRDDGIDLLPDPDAGPLTVRHIEVAPGNSDSVYVMGEKHTARWGLEFERVRGFVYHSTDGGGRFTLLQEFDSLTRWLFIDPDDTDRLLLATGIFDREADVDDPVHPSGPGLGLFRSGDGGLTWQASNDGLDPQRSLFVGGADRHPTDPNTFVVATGNNADYNKGLYGGIYRSADGGITWADVTPVYPWPSEPFTAVAFSASDPDVVYVGSATAIYRSSDAGFNWTRHEGTNGAPYGPEGVRSGVPIDMVVGPDDPDLLYVNNYGGGVFRSDDGAKTWISWSRGYTGADIHDLAMNPSDARHVMANGRSGVFVSTDEGTNWQGISNGPAAFPEGFGVAFDPSDSLGNTLLAADEHEGFLLRSTNGGVDWLPVLYLESGEIGNRHGERTIRFAPSDSSRVYAGFMAAGFHADPHDLAYPASLGVYRSDDGGVTWEESGSALPSDEPSRNVTDIAVSHQDPDVVYVSLRHGGVFKSYDGGSTWASANGALPLGESWDDVWADHDPIPRHSLLSVVVSPDDHDTVFIGSNMFGIYVSTDGGANWATALMPLELIAQGTRDHAHVTSLAVHPMDPSRLYAAEWHGGVYMSKDGGATWTQINDGLSTRAVARLALAGGRLYAATQGEGVFRMPITGIATSIDVEAGLPQRHLLYQNFPNPFDATTEIAFDVATAGRVRLTVYDARGRVVARPLDDVLAEGRHVVSFDAAGLASGTYIYELRAGRAVRRRPMAVVR